jgi:hypothetical protein
VLSICNERKRMLDEYGRAVELLVYLGRRLSSPVVSFTHDEFRREAARCERVRRECTALREQLDQHSREHRCAVPLKNEAAEMIAHAGDYRR